MKLMERMLLLFALCAVHVSGQIDINQQQQQHNMHQQNGQQQPIENLHVQAQMNQQQQQPNIVNQANVPPQQVPVNSHPPPEGDVTGRTNRLRDKSHIHDKEHIKEHLQDVISPEDSGREMTEDELEFYYFKLHDYDQNNRLDGVEIMKAMFHFDEKDHQSDTKVDEEEIFNLVSDVLEEFDKNLDGFIDYPEYSSAQLNG
ncbi:multiple coagulation factor deficiency protein 2 homolog isoform X1 [Antedon mediterranea]|uniref:multiple coagulation factor deficiency protein 2 homolog isoform X1 n=1 Tax=Antedon mediterranea TaxID=105859 RepID=UPI003AF50D2C